MLVLLAFGLGYLAAECVRAIWWRGQLRAAEAEMNEARRRALAAAVERMRQDPGIESTLVQMPQGDAVFVRRGPVLGKPWPTVDDSDPGRPN